MQKLVDNSKKGFLVCVDFKKTFDSVNHKYMKRALEEHGFPNKLIKTISLLLLMFETVYNKAESSVMNHGNTGKVFEVQRGCRQGDCMSPHLFLVAINLLIQTLNEDTDMRTIDTLGQDNGAIAYADNLAIW